MIINVEGMEGVGKSTFMYTAPLPIVAFSLDMGHQRSLYGKLFPQFFKDLKINVVKYQAGAPAPTGFVEHDITVFELPAPIQLNPDKLAGYVDQWQYFIQRFAWAIQEASVATVGVDTMTILRKNKCDAYLEELQGQGKARKQLQQIEYGHPDGEIRRLYTIAQALGKNLIVTHHLRDHYAPTMQDGVITSQADGTYEIDGVKDTGRMVDIIMRIEKAGPKLTGRMTKCGLNLDLEGLPIPMPTWNRVMDMLQSNWYGPDFPRRDMPEIEAGK